MSLCTTRRRPSTHTAKPAVIRPVPPTFGLGILPPLNEAERVEALNAALDIRKARVEAAVPFVSAALDARRTLRRHTPSGIDAAWDLGYRLGAEGIAANPASDYNHRERVAFIDGYDRGLRDFHAAEIYATEAWLAERDRMFDGADHDLWGDGAEMGSLLGHAG